jgi:hypothetical protein
VSASGGTVYLRGETWTINYTVDGRRVREAIGGSKKLAEMVLKKRVTDAIENRWFNKRNVGLTPFSEFADTYIARHVSLLKAANTENVRALFWKREFGNRPIGQITSGELQDWQARKRQTNKPATVNRMMCRLRHMFNKAVEWEVLDESPMRRIKFLRENNARLRYLSLEECQKLLDSCIVPHMRAIATIALHTGMSVVRFSIFAAVTSIWPLDTWSLETRRTVSHATSRWTRRCVICSRAIYPRRATLMYSRAPPEAVAIPSRKPFATPGPARACLICTFTTYGIRSHRSS